MITVRIEVNGVPGVPDGTYAVSWPADQYDNNPESVVAQACAFQIARIVQDRCEKAVRQA